MMLDITLLCSWLTALPTQADYEFVPGPREPEYGKGDLVAVVTLLEGAGLSLEGAGDRPSFQVKLTAREYQLPQLQNDAFLVDGRLIFGDYPADLWGTRVQFVDRTGGGPGLLQEDDLDRIAYVCTYLVHETPEML